MLFEFSRDFVFYKKINNFEEVNKHILDGISERRGQEGRSWDICETITSFKNDSEFNGFLMDPLVADNVVWDPLDEMLELVIPTYTSEYPLPQMSNVRQCWYNIYPPGNFQEIHAHPASGVNNDGLMYYPSYSIIYIAQLGGAPNSTVFTRPTTIPGNPSATRENFNTSTVDEIADGTVLVFPAHLEHYVLPYVGDSERISIAYNIDSHYPNTLY